MNAFKIVISTQTLERPPHVAHYNYRPGSLMRQSALTPTTNQPTQTSPKGLLRVQIIALKASMSLFGVLITKDV